MPFRRCGALAMLAVSVAMLLTGCVVEPSTSASASAIRTGVQSVMPFQPANSVWYSRAVLAARKPFARWEQARDRIELVTWPRTCAEVPVVIAFVPGTTRIDVELGRAPRSSGPRQCAAGRVLTSTFVASRAIRRDRTTTLHLAGATVRLPPAPAMVPERVARTVERAGTAHPLRQVDGPLPQYSVREYPWTLAAPVSSTSRTVSIGWAGGTCQENASVVYVHETDRSVTIDTALAPPPLQPGPPRRGRTEVCAGVGIGLAATVHLDRPLGSRALLQHQYVARPADQDAF